jgi:hypothetical protein
MDFLVKAFHCLKTRNQFHSPRRGVINIENTIIDDMMLHSQVVSHGISKQTPACASAQDLQYRGIIQKANVVALALALRFHVFFIIFIQMRRKPNVVRPTNPVLNHTRR